MLHTVNKSPFQSPLLGQCLARVGEGAALLLIEDAVYAATRGVQGVQALLHGASCPVHVLLPDLVARGFRESDIADGVTAVDYAGFVRLCVEHECVQSWL